MHLIIIAVLVWLTNQNQPDKKKEPPPHKEDKPVVEKAIRDRRREFDKAIAGLTRHFTNVLGSDFHAVRDVEKIGGMFTGICECVIGDYRFISVPELYTIVYAAPLHNLITRKLLAKDIPNGE